MSEIYTGREEPPSNIAESLTRLILDRAEKTPNRDAFSEPAESGGWKSYTWKQIIDDSAVIAAGLIALGVESEDRVGLASDTNLDWIRGTYGISLAGAAVTTVYASTSAADTAFILADSGSRVLFAQDADQLAKVTEFRGDLPNLQKVILFDGDGDGDFVMTLDELRSLGRSKLEEDPEIVNKRAANVRGDHLATLIYTSGTTGEPKGVELLQSSWGSVAAAVALAGDLRIDDFQFLWLPLAHVFGSVLLVAQLEVGFKTAVDGRVTEIIKNLPELKPTMMAAVPRIFEKVYAGVRAQLADETGVKASIAGWAMNVGDQWVTQRLETGEAPGGLLGMQYKIADKLVFSKIRSRLGGRLRILISGSAALSSEVSRWFLMIGLPIREGYGLTETSAMGTLIRGDNLNIGTVGEPVPGMEIMIADDGEILLRGAGVMRGYHNRPDANAEAFATGDGWFSTGDIGAFDVEGGLKITDRKKDLVKTSGGKYIAPSAIESRFKGISGLAANMIVHANGRKFASALITLDVDAAAKWATAHGKPDDLETLSTDPELVAEIEASVDELNSGLNHWETIKKFKILDRDLTIESGELTPSLKVKRKVVEERYKDILDALYT